MRVDQAVAEQANEDEAAAVNILDRNDEPAMFGGTEVERDGENVIEGAQPVQIGVIGINSKAYAKAEAWQRKQFQLLGGRKPNDQEEREIFAGFLARCCRWWKGFFDANDQPIPFSTENATDLFLKLPFVRRQVQGAVGNARLFGQKTASG
jgi:hypothetical protein